MTIFLTGLIVSSCVQQAAPVNLVPYIDYSTFTSYGKSIKVVHVKTGEVNMPFENLKITGEVFQKAISETLEEANLFEVVLGGKIADYECHSIIISQKVIPGITANAILFVSYRLIDVKTKGVVWSETILSQYDTYGGDLTNAIETAARDNLSKFITKLSIGLDPEFLKAPYVAKAQQPILQIQKDVSLTTAQNFPAFKQNTLNEFGAFDFQKRLYIYEKINELANLSLKLRSPKVTLKKKTIGGAVIGVLDSDDDGLADAFATHPGDQDFGFLYDLNKDCKMDYLILNGGIVPSKDFKAFWFNFHWIDSNHDGKMDIHVENDLDLDGDKLPDKGITAWVYDSDFDGKIDKAEYIGKDFKKAIEKTDGTFVIKRQLGLKLQLREFDEFFPGESYIFTEFVKLAEDVCVERKIAE